MFDAEHRQILGLVNDFYESVISGVTEKALLTVLNGLILSSANHFAHEEEFFDLCRYSGGDAHKAEHQKLLRELMEFREVRLKGDLRELAFDMNIVLVRWFTVHTVSLDREFCTELRKLGIR